MRLDVARCTRGEKKDIIYIYIYKERERDRQTDKQTKAEKDC